MRPWAFPLWRFMAFLPIRCCALACALRPLSANIPQMTKGRHECYGADRAHANALNSEAFAARKNTPRGVKPSQYSQIRRKSCRDRVRSGMREFESSHSNGGLLRISHRSPGSDFGHSQSETADNLRRTFEKFPFLGDCGRRPGSICTTWPRRHS